MKNAAMAVTIEKLRSECTRKKFTDECHKFVEDELKLPVVDANDRSWGDCFDFLVKHLPKEAPFQKFHLIFEFVMPDSERRADVIVLSKKKVLVLEFKNKEEIKKDDVAQAAGYGQSISHYHYQTEENDMSVHAYLVYTHVDPAGDHHLIDILTPDNFARVFAEEFADEQSMSDDECAAWIASPFHPLKNIAEATLQLFRDGDLPNIKSIREGDIKDTLTKINSVIKDASSRKSIIFVSGVPGAGKTLVGLKTVYDNARPDKNLSPIFLSGNDPLVNILQKTLSLNGVDHEGKSYIQPMKKFKSLAYDDTVPMHDIIVFDEAQRAWDTDHREKGQTEATLLLRIGERIAARYDKVTIVCLIGDRQAIHVNEESGIAIWADALLRRDDWNVYVPEKYSEMFKDIPKCEVVAELMLDTSIRNDFIDVSPWVEAILNADLESAKTIFRSMLAKGFKCWRFRCMKKLPDAVKYVQENYPGSHTGLVVSSHRIYGIDNERKYFGEQYSGSFVEAEQAYDWYMRESYELKHGASEFLIQGIELEYPIVCFGGDYYITQTSHMENIPFALKNQHYAKT